jgi:Uma2 family endonuclease
MKWDLPWESEAVMSTGKVKINLGLRSAGMRMTPEEFDAVTRYDDRYCYELIHGVVVVNPIPLEAEGDPNGELEFLLRYYKHYHPQGSALDKTLAERYVRTGDSRRRADRIIWAGLCRLPEPLFDVPAIVAEFVSAGKRNYLRDYQEKRDEYMAIGVKEYWIVDRFRRVMTVYRNGPNGVEERIVQENEIYCTDLLPGFELPLGRLLALADEWRK